MPVSSMALAYGMVGGHGDDLGPCVSATTLTCGHQPLKCLLLFPPSSLWLLDKIFGGLIEGIIAVFPPAILP